MSEIETNATVPTPEETAEQPERTFTQAEVDSIVEGRLKRERAKYSDYEALKSKATAYDEAQEASKTDLERATERAEELQKQLDALTTANQERELREKIATETGVPVNLLRGSSEEDLRSQAEAILGFANTKRAPYPNVKDGGETTPPTMTRDAILGIKDERKRLEAIKNNIHLFS